MFVKLKRVYKSRDYTFSFSRFQRIITDAILFNYFWLIIQNKTNSQIYFFSLFDFFLS